MLKRIEDGQCCVTCDGNVGDDARPSACRWPGFTAPSAAGAVSFAISIGAEICGNTVLCPRCSELGRPYMPLEDRDGEFVVGGTVRIVGAGPLLDLE